ncbi:MAG: 3-deoxy-7-phosphoheptulonate synthase class II [Alphaproteobacteria bacterium]|nr:3-deoxy-7-phosphoheptulonate synthase class II [Alphaproteobacteria bacterium]
MTNGWAPNSWREKQALQIPKYPNQELLVKAEQIIAKQAPLIFAGEARNLKKHLAKVCRGEAFLLQGGDCAESFRDFSANNVKDNFKIILQMSIILTFAGSMPVVKIARMAGQFAKPRSSDTQVINDMELPSYRGDIINSADFKAEKRMPNPMRMVRAYNQSASTLNLLRAFAQGGFADLHKIHAWTQDFVKDSKAGEKFSKLASQIDDTLNFMQSCGITSEHVKQIRETDLYTSHEALLLGYEEALTRKDSVTGKWYNTSAHMLWIGERTRKPNMAHAEFFRGIENPIGVKCGANITSDEVIEMCDILNPHNEEGRLTLIIRMGADNISEKLPSLIRKVKSEGRNVIWSSDPMHGNTIKSSTGYRTRKLESIWKEIETFFDIHKAEGTYAGGVHLEMTGKNVTECTGGAIGITEQDLSDRYYTFCDPRLNAEQALEISFLIADKIKKNKS